MITLTGKRFAYLTVGLLAFAGLFRITPTEAASLTFHRLSQIQVGDHVKTITPFGGKFRGGTTVASGDVNGDGTAEYIVGAGPGGGPQVEVYTASGKRILSFFAFDPKMNTGINVAAGDLGGEGKAEIVVASQPGYPATVEIFSSDGKKVSEFKPYGEEYSGGLHIAVLPAHAGLPGKIIVASGVEHDQEVRVYDASGRKLEQTWQPFGKKSGAGVNVAAAWSDEYHESIIVAGSGWDRAPEVLVYGLQSKKVLARWDVYKSTLRSGVRVAADNQMIATGPGTYGGAVVQMYNHHGALVASYLAFEAEFRGGVEVALTQAQGISEPIAVPSAQAKTGAELGKRIIVYLKEQKLVLVENGNVISVRKVSTGKWGMPTPIGEFATRNKIPTAYSKPYNLYMDWWMAFTADGKYGIHSLPFWKLKNGGRLYEGEAHLGRPVSHGCIRQSLADAKSLYDWAPLGTLVSVRP